MATNKARTRRTTSPAPADPALLGTTEEATRPYIEQFDPRDILAQNAEPDANVREELGNLEELGASIADDETGLIQFPVLVPRQDGTMLLVAGFRRSTAAVEAGVEKLDYIVRADWAHLSPGSIRLAMLKENKHRKDLTVVEEAKGFAQLMLFAGMTVEKIAKSGGFKKEYVQGQLDVAKLDDDKAVKLANERRLTFEDAAAIEEFADQPKIQARIIRKIDEQTNTGRWGGAHIVAEERKKRDMRKEAALRIKELRDGGAVILAKKPKDFGYRSVECDVRHLTDAEGNALDGDKLVYEKGFAALRDSNQGYPQVVVVCLDPEAHRYKRTSWNDQYKRTSPAETAAKQEAERLQAERQAAFEAALSAATEVRQNFLAETYGSVKSKLAKAILAKAIRVAAAAPANLGIHDRAKPLLDRLAGFDVETIDETTSTEKLNRALVARYLVTREALIGDMMRSSRWASDAKKQAVLAWQDLLIADGYSLSDAENELRDMLLDQIKPPPAPRETAEDTSAPCRICDAEIDEACDPQCDLLYEGEDAGPGDDADATPEQPPGNDPDNDPHADHDESTDVDEPGEDPADDSDGDELERRFAAELEAADLGELVA